MTDTPVWDADARRFRLGGRLLVYCDERCHAYEEPNMANLEEVTAAYEHWAGHECLSGCSHGR
jgi:hypothetical protein